MNIIMLSELQSLSALASSRPDVRLVVGDESDCRWSFNWSTCTITVNPSDLALRPPDYCRGLILHESAHAALTRLWEIVPSDLFQADIHRLLNVIEDCRIENWLQLRFPGCRPWIRLYNDRLFANPSGNAAVLLAADPAGGFLSGLLDYWWHREIQIDLHADSKAALMEVIPFFDKAVVAFPEPTPPDWHSTRRTYESHPVSICYRAMDCLVDPSSEECVIRMFQHLMWAITWKHIVPVFRRLLAHPDSEPTRNQIASLNFQHSTLSSKPSHEPEDLQSRIFRLKKANAQLLQNSDKIFPKRSGDFHVYAKAVAQNAVLIESCAATLLRYLTVEAHPRRTRFHRSGQILDLGVAMQFDADPRQYERLWQRTTLPCKPDRAFVLLIDSSGSMRGDKAEATFASLVVLREVCIRLSIPLTIIAFSNQAELIQRGDSPWSPYVQSRLVGLLESSGSTRILSALDIAEKILTEVPNRHSYLWVLSDGDTQGPDDARSKLQTLRSNGVMIHGLGLGPDSQQIASLIPGSSTGISPQMLPQELTRIFEAQIQNRQCA